MERRLAKNRLRSKAWRTALTAEQKRDQQNKKNEWARTKRTQQRLITAASGELEKKRKTPRVKKINVITKTPEKQEIKRAKARAKYWCDPTVARERGNLKYAKMSAEKKADRYGKQMAWRKKMTPEKLAEAAEHKRKARAADPAKYTAIARKAALKFKYKMTPEDYDARVLKQGGCCALCGKPVAEGKRLVVDHDHKTGLVRGLLHPACNTGLGKLGDNLEGLALAVAYLEKARGYACNDLVLSQNVLS